MELLAVLKRECELRGRGQNRVKVISLGETYKDTVSGMTGIADQTSQRLAGGDSVKIVCPHPKGERPIERWVDVDLLELVSEDDDNDAY